MSLPRYPNYRDSGVEWLGEVPGHWDVIRVKNALASMGSGGTPDTDTPMFWADDDGISWVAIADMSERDYVEATAKHLTHAGLNSKRLSVWPEGTLLFSMYASLGHVAVLRLPAATNQAILALVPKPDISQSFLKRWFEFLRPGLREHASSNTQDNLNAEKVRNLVAVRPPLPEQLHIAAFLDRETAKIDALVAEQLLLIDLLKEKRQAVISHAVTKGLNPDAPMKDSGIEWLGEVPAHWAICKCGFYLSILSGFAFPSAGFSQDETDTKLLRGINVGVSTLRWHETVYWRRAPGDELDPYELRRGDLVIGMDRPLISDGMRVAKVTEKDLPCLLLQRVALLKTSDRLDADYLMVLLSSPMFVAHFSPDTTGVSVPHISPEQIANFVIPIPPAAEQQKIIAHLGRESARLDLLTLEAQRAIDLLQERRTALISAAVTGQIDVRPTAERASA